MIKRISCATGTALTKALPEHGEHPATVEQSLPGGRCGPRPQEERCEADDGEAGEIDVANVEPGLVGEVLRQNVSGRE